MSTDTTNTPPPTLTLVVGISADETGLQAWRRAVEIAEAAPSTHVHLCHCAGPIDDLAEKRLTEGETRLGAWAAAQLVGDELITRCEIHVDVGDPAGVLRQLAVDVNADMIVVGTHNKGTLARLAKGSVVHDLLLDAPCSVIVAMPKDHEGIDKSPKVEAAHPAHAADRTLGLAHRYHYRRSVRLNLPNSGFGIGRTTA